MNIKFKLPYHTTYGDELLLNIAPSPEDDNLGLDLSQFKVLAMTTHDGATWTLDTTLDSKDVSRYNYFYSVRGIRGIKCSEWKTVMHRLDLTATKANTYEVNDRWIDFPGDTYMYSSAFTDCVNRRAQIPAQPTNYATTLRLVVRAPQLRSGMRLHLVGAQAALGNWDLSKSLPMTEHSHNEWYVDIDASLLFATSKRGSKKAYDDSSEIEFKFVAIGDKNEIEWETCNNRILAVEPLKQGELRSIALDQAFFALYDEKVAGTLIPVFSLRSEGSFGVGDFGDLKLMIDWVAKTHQRLLQVLPINDSTSTHTWTDSYPYSCISVFALHPQYCDIRQLPAIDDKVEADRFEMLREELNALPQIDYERVNNAKIKYLQMLFKQEGKKVLESEDFKSFFKAANHWLVPYAQYCYLRDKNGTCEFAKWEDHNQWNEADRDALSNPQNKAFEDVAFFYYVQYVLDRQMRSAHDYARARGVILKGDIPIGVNRNGCDVWHEPEYFHLDSQAGAPPDAFSVNGQNWGFPTYNWERMIADGCQWWVRRFQNMQQYFDAYRIDHVLGFFRIWEVPTNQIYGLLGYFRPALPFSISEIGHFGFTEDVASLCIPQVNEAYLQQLIAETQNEHLAEQYFEPLNNHSYTLKEGYRSQRALMQLLPEGKTRQALLNVACEVLFIQDPERHDLYHPRIAAQLTHLYTTLSDQNRDAFNRLHDDFFYHRNNQFWADEAMKKIPTVTQSSDNQHPTLQLYPLQGTGMLPCAEDLGMVPASVKGVLERLQILSLEIQRMPKEYGVRFGHLNNNPYLSVTTIATHDMPPLRLWWQQNAERRQAFWNEALHHEGEAPTEATPEICEEIIKQHLQSPSMLCLLALQDWLSISPTLRSKHPETEQINDPANPNQYWRYRMHLTIEELMQQSGFNDKIRALIAQRS